MKIFILFLTFFLIVKIYSISGADNEEYSSEDPENENDVKEVNLREVCPCDMTQNQCDLGCCCDKDCLDLMLNQEYYDSYPECDASSSFSKNLDSKLDYCDGYKKSLDDLYNPLVLAFKILKKGYCLAKNVDPDDDINEDYKIDDDDNISTENEENENFKNYTNIPSSTKNFDLNMNDFENVNFNAPIALPNGMCLFGYFQIEKYQDYEVTCSYQINNDIIRYMENYYYLDSFTENFYIHNNYYDNDSNGMNNLAIKKIEIIFFLDNNTTNISLYYNENNEAFQDLTMEVRFLRNQSDYPRSGNPGYIKGKPILFRQEINPPNKYKIYNILPIDENEDLNGRTLYYDNYMDNILTFEDFTIYGYKNCRSCLFSNIFNDELFFYFGNANINNDKDGEKIDGRINETSSFLLIGKYDYVGAVNNSQNRIYELKFDEDVNFDSRNVKYFINKFIKPKKMGTKWWYAPGPGFIRLPRNIMYPFRIGTTQYTAEKTNNE